MNRYYLKLTTLTPVHIGTGEVYEPTNFVIDNGYLYEFDEVLFYKSLDEISKKDFESKINDLFQVISFYRKNINKAKSIYHNKVEVSKEIENRYKNQFNKDGSLNKNQLNIDKTYKDINTHLPVIPGSSIKGVFDTFLKIYAKPEVASNEIRQKLKISDALAINVKTKIGIAKRVHRNPDKKAKSSIPINLEVIGKDSSFIFTIDTDFDMVDIVKKIKFFYETPQRNSSYFKLTNNSFVIRIGKYSGKPYIVYNPKNIKNSYGRSIATHTIFESSEFGWVKIEYINKNEYKELLQSHLSLKEKVLLETEQKLKEIKNYIKQQELKRKELKKQKELERQKRAEIEKEQKEEDFKKAKDTDDIEFLEKFILKYKNEEIDFAKARLEVLKEQQKKNKLLLLEQKAKKSFDELVKKKRNLKQFEKQCNKFINKWSKKSENKGSKFILELVDKARNLKG